MADGDVLLVESGHQAFGAVSQSSVTGLTDALAAKATVAALGGKANAGGAAIPDLALGSTGIGAVDTVLAAAQTKVNATLAALRTSGLIQT